MGNADAIKKLSAELAVYAMNLILESGQFINEE